MLCGLYPPSSGTAQIFGYDLRTQMDKIRCIMGYCPQVNILFDEFTVEEHLKLIAMVIRIILIILVKKSCF
jgi:ABC-type multidrug transport system ATPase subunit